MHAIIQSFELLGKKLIILWLWLVKVQVRRECANISGITQKALWRAWKLEKYINIKLLGAANWRKEWTKEIKRSHLL